MTNKNTESTISNDNQSNDQCCTSGCNCCCTSNQLASFIRHIARYFDKKE